MTLNKATVVQLRVYKIQLCGCLHNYSSATTNDSVLLFGGWLAGAAVGPFAVVVQPTWLLITGTRTG